jgi:hypothetical protein
MELLIKISFSFFLGVGIGVMLMQVSALVWMFWDMFKSKQK